MSPLPTHIHILQIHTGGTSTGNGASFLVSDPGKWQLFTVREDLGLCNRVDVLPNDAAELTGELLEDYEAFSLAAAGRVVELNEPIFNVMDLTISTIDRAVRVGVVITLPKSDDVYCAQFTLALSNKILPHVISKIEGRQTLLSGICVVNTPPAAVIGGMADLLTNAICATLTDPRTLCNAPVVELLGPRQLHLETLRISLLTLISYGIIQSSTMGTPAGRPVSSWPIPTPRPR